ncbi:MAG TPA: L-threonylcarbamoyladenylate synthase [Solirubrobacteraceae bacterium]|nr:L-threonylcarbamoyladenylate synthase [Solirubrobacteraceae bacterium]
MTLSAGDAERLERCLAGDGVALIPTDTVYGLACNPDSAAALRRIYELKRRPPQKPAAVMFFSLRAALATLTELGPRELEAVRALLPGPVTLLLPNPQRRFPFACEPAVGLAGDETTAAAQRGLAPRGLPPVGSKSAEVAPLGLRVPRLQGALAALTGVRAPVLQSSANLSGEPAPRRLTDVPAILREGVDIVLDGGELPGIASTVIDLSGYERDGVWRVVREGPLAVGKLRQVLASVRDSGAS